MKKSVKKSKDKGRPKLTKAEKEKNDFLKTMHPASKIPRTLGEKAADFITGIAGSWGFIIGFLIIFILWIGFNTSWILFGETWDPYPFILLNLALSCLAAIQAPIILMSQNRAAQRDRVRAQYDYAINVKAEKEIEQIKKQLVKIENAIKKK